MSNRVFAARVRVAYVRVAREVLAEDPETTGYPLRSAFARTVLTVTDLAGPGYAPLIATDPAVSAAAEAGHVEGQGDSAQAAVTDTMLQDAVRRGWNLSAGVSEWHAAEAVVD
ncbi:hypothetical protein [Streptomyces sp. NPDC091278]|uniref:hypothetical protein n=1 Tax=Streptomyces sp. NPDC091278 TaxID=3155301 RepID=UPI00344DC717